MMDRRDGEDTLSRQLEAHYLHQHSYHVEEQYGPCKKQQQIQLQRERDEAQQTAQRERTCVAHKDLRRMAVVPEKPEHCADYGRGHHAEFRAPHYVWQRKVAAHGRMGDKAAQTEQRDRGHGNASAGQTIERILAMFPPAEHKLLLSQLAGTIEAIISQRLLATLKGERRPAVEILRGNAVTEKLILENRLNEVTDYIETGEAGMQSFDQHILKMYQEDLISGTEAMRWASRPETLAMAMRGIKTSDIR